MSDQSWHFSGLAYCRQERHVSDRLRGKRSAMSRSWSEYERQKLAAEIAALQSLDVAQLKACWRNLYATEAPSRFSRDLLMRSVA
jgi:hypothetical protein